MARNIVERFYYSSRWCKSLVILTVVIICFLVYSGGHVVREGFIQREKYVSKEGVSLYDAFYASIYDELLFDKVKNKYEVGEIIRITGPTQRSLILDIGSGTGDHVAAFAAKKINAMGLDTSSAMVAEAKKKYPQLKFVKGDTTNVTLFPAQTFTHITCLYFTLYYVQDKALFFKNCYEWLQPGGYLTIHLVNRDQFDPILGTADPLYMVSPQKYAKERMTTSLIKFNGFQYKGKFLLDKSRDMGFFDETFKDKQGKVRQNKHILYMPTQKYIIDLAQSIGFILQGKIDLVPVQYEYQYLYVLYKPN